MAKYCDHGLYGSATITANTNGTSTLNVTAVSGAIGIGQMLSGVDMPANAYIGAAGTGTGGIGTYTIYVGGSATAATGTGTGRSITGTYGNPAVVPVWSAAQDGDGTASDAATAATVSIPLSAYTAAAGAAIAIGGATLTCVASGATNNQFNAGASTTLIDNIVAAINRAGNTVTVTGPTGFPTPRIQDSVFARRNGNNLEIMTRAGSASYNSTATFMVITTGFTGGTQLDNQFSGGVGGAWGYLFTPLGVSWATAVAAASYGIWATNGPYAGSQVAGDIVYVRSNKTFTVDFASPTMPNRGAVNNPVRYILDDSTQWADGAYPAITMNFRGGAGNPFTLTFGTSGANYANIEGGIYPDGAYSLRIVGSNTGSPINCAYNGSGYVSGVYLEQTSTTTSGLTQLRPGASGNNAKCGFRTCKVKASNSNPFFSPTGSDLAAEYDCSDLVFDNEYNTNIHNGILAINGSPNGPFSIAGLKCQNFIVGSRLITSAGIRLLQQTNITDLVPENVSVISPQLYTAAATLVGEYRDKVLTISTRLNKRDFTIETARGSVEWNYAAGFPYLNALLDDGSATPWSVRVRPSTVAGQTNYSAPITLPRIAKINSLANGARTFRINFCISDAVTWTRKDISVFIQYVDTAGNIVSLDSLDLAGAALSAASDVTWSAESGGKVVYTDGGTLSFNKWKIEVATTTGRDLATGTEVTAVVRVNKTVANVTQYLFIDPEISIS